MPAVSELLVRIDATTESLRRELQRAGASLNSFESTAEKSMKQVDNSFSKLGSSLGGIQSALGTLGLAMGGMEMATSFVKMADAATTMENRLKSVTGSVDEMKRAQDLLYASSQENSVETGTSVEMFARLSRALKGSGADTERLVEIVDTLSKVTRLSGTSTAEASSALLQLSQALNAGRLNGDEFRSMAENLPMLLDGIAEHVANLNGISLEQARAELKEMGSEGELTTDVIIGATENMREEVVKAFSELQSTAAGAATRMWNSLTRLVGKIDDIAGVSDTLIERLDAVSSAFDIGVGALDRYGGGLASLLNFINSIPHPLSLLAQAASAASAQIAQAAGQIESVMKNAAAARAEIGSGVQPWQMQPGQAGKWQGNITRMGTEEGKAALASKLAGGLEFIEARRGAPTVPVLTNPQDVAGVMGGNVDFTTFGVAPETAASRLAGGKGDAGRRITGVVTEKPVLKFYKAQSKEEEKISGDLKKRAEKLGEQVKTPQEEFQGKVSEYQTMLAKELISPEEYRRAFNEAGDKMQDALLSGVRKKAKPATKMSDELKRRAERVRDEIATADQEYDRRISELTKLRETGRITEAEFAQGKEYYGKELAEAKKPKKGRKAPKTEEEKAQERAERQGAAIFEETRTGAEDYGKEVERLGDLLRRGAIDQETYDRAVADAGFTMQEQQMTFRGSQDAARAYLDEIARLDSQLAAGSISQDEYNLRVLDAQQKYSEARSNSAAYADEITRLDKALAEGRISQEEYAASVDLARSSMSKAAQEGAALIEEMRTPLERYNAEMQKLSELWAAGAIGDDTKMRKAAQLMETLREETLATNEQMRRLQDMSDDLGMVMAGAFEDAVLEGGKLRDILSGLWDDIQRIVMRQLVTIPLASAISSVIGGAVMGGMMPMGGMAEGGEVKGLGSSTSDSVPALLSSGEFVVNAQSAKRHRAMLEAINDNRLGSARDIPRFASGGIVGSIPHFATGGFVGSSGPQSSAPIEIKLENKSSAPLKLESAQQRKGPNGGTMISVMVTDAVKAALNAGEFDKGMGSRYGAAVQPIGR